MLSTPLVRARALSITALTGHLMVPGAGINRSLSANPISNATTTPTQSNSPSPVPSSIPIPSFSPTPLLQRPDSQSPSRLGQAESCPDLFTTKPPLTLPRPAAGRPNTTSAIDVVTIATDSLPAIHVRDENDPCLVVTPPSDAQPLVSEPTAANELDVHEQTPERSPSTSTDASPPHVTPGSVTRPPKFPSRTQSMKQL